MGRSGVEKIYTLVKNWRFRRNLFSGNLYRRAIEHDRVRLPNQARTVTVVTVVATGSRRASAGRVSGKGRAVGRAHAPTRRDACRAFGYDSKSR